MGMDVDEARCERAARARYTFARITLRTVTDERNSAVDHRNVGLERRAAETIVDAGPGKNRVNQGV